MQLITATIIGFTQRRQTVSEADRPFEVDQFFRITVDVRSMAMSEINHFIVFEVPGSNMDRTARVGPSLTDNILRHDALFGTLNVTTGNLQDTRLLPSGSTVLQTQLTLTIINDFIVESQECFTISIVSRDGQLVYGCFDDDDNVDSFFCLHEICIEDDDGLF